jgi:hypothetical protein
LQLDGGSEGLPRGAEDAERFITAKLDDLSACRRHHLTGESGEPRGELSRLLVAVRLCEPRVAADVGD